MISAAACCGEVGHAEADGSALDTMVRADWDLQEKRLGRSPQSIEAIQAALRRAVLLLEDLRGIQGVGDLAVEADELKRWALSRSEPRPWTRRAALISTGGFERRRATWL